MDRLLDKLYAAFVQLPAHLQRRFQVPALVGVHANALAATRHYPVEKGHVTGHPHLHLEDSVGARLVDFPVHHLGRVDADRKRGGRGLAGIQTEHVVKGSVFPFALDVPQGKVECCSHRRAVGQAPAEVPRHQAFAY